MNQYIKNMTIVLLACTYSRSYSGEISPFIEKYTQSIPCLEYDKKMVISPKDKACLIQKYLCSFIPPKKTLSFKGNTELEDKIEYLITNQKQISLVILGFPFKSTNHEKKCLGPNVDLGEYLGFTTLNQLTQNIKSLYPNTHCTIISDGLAYHINDYDPSYEDIHNYHETMHHLTTNFKDVSFVSWKINSKFDSYQELQERVAAVLLKDKDSDKKRSQEMKAFVSSEFKCTHWETVFLQKATALCNETQQKEQKQKNRDQAIRTAKNAFIKKNIDLIVPELVYKGKQFSSLVSTQWPNYNECIRLSVHCDRDVIDVSTKIPINIIHGHSGTPWHNAVVVSSDNAELKGLARDVFKKDELNLVNKSKKEFSLKTGSGTLSLSYISHQ